MDGEVKGKQDNEVGSQ